MDQEAARAAFLRELRKVLSSLYSPGLLRRSPLIRLFGLEGRVDGPGALQRLLIDAIERLEPASGTPPGSDAWRICQLLRARFIDQFTQEEVAGDLFLSARQLRRLEHDAAELLADQLWLRHGLERRAMQLVAPLAPDVGEPVAEAQTAAQEQELAWLERTMPSEPASLCDLVHSVLQTGQPLLNSLGVVVVCDAANTLPALTVQPTAIRQALLHVVTMAAQRAPGGRVTVSATALPDQLSVCVHVVAHPRDEQTPFQGLSAAAPGGEGVEVAGRLIQLSGGALEVSTEDGFRADIRLPTMEQVPVLVVDDNADTLRLLERFLAGSRYRFLGTADPHQALALADGTPLGAIILDVMLPGMDGWDLLGRLREHPKTRAVPVIVSTILPQTQLAAMLGAAEFMSKPIRREALLVALDRLVRLAPPGSH